MRRYELVSSMDANVWISSEIWKGGSLKCVGLALNKTLKIFLQKLHVNNP